LRDTEKEYRRRNVQPLVVIAQQAFQLRSLVRGDVDVPVLVDPVAAVSATYGVAFQTQFRDEQGPWSSRPAIFVIDPGGVLR
jgi:peroxiredoxin